jgi:hypothetical protein
VDRLHFGRQRARIVDQAKRAVEDRVAVVGEVRLSVAGAFIKRRLRKALLEPPDDPAQSERHDLDRCVKHPELLDELGVVDDHDELPGGESDRFLAEQGAPAALRE